jgi:hypothetical protein
MLHKNIVKSLEKNGFKVEKDSENYTHLEFFICKNERNVMSWRCDEGMVTCIHIKGIEQEDNIYTDYFPGNFYDTIKSALNSFKS